MSALHALLAGAIDYAGLFPPASLDMATAVAEYAAYRAGEDAWLLGRLIVPVSRLAELEREAADHLPRDADVPWSLSALVGADPQADLDAMLAFNERHALRSNGGLAVIDAAEMKADSAARVERAAALVDSGFETYVEIPASRDPEPLLAAIRDARARAKVRTGGVTRDAFPDAADLARFIAACARLGVPFKATAGLHHPMRAEYRLTYDAHPVRGTMFGFLNVFMAAALARTGMRDSDLTAVLEEREAGAFIFGMDDVSWRGHRADARTVAEARRKAVMSFGSCSFREPVDELETLGLL